MLNFLLAYGYQPKLVKDNTKPLEAFIYAEGQEDWLAVAHTDTVLPTPTNLMITTYLNSNEAVRLSGEGGLGADDRAGVAMIIKLIRDGHRPHVLFPSGEESGGLGTKAFTKSFKTNFEPINVNFMIQFDRMNNNEIVNYSDANPALIDYFTSSFFVKAIGSYTDIKDLMPFFGASGINISVGYRGQHTANEYLDLEAFTLIYAQFSLLFNNFEKNIKYAYKEPPAFTPAYTSFSNYTNYSYDSSYARSSGYYTPSSKLTTSVKPTSTRYDDAEEFVCELCEKKTNAVDSHVYEETVVCKECLDKETAYGAFVCPDCGSVQNINFTTFEFMLNTIYPICNSCSGTMKIMAASEELKKDFADELVLMFEGGIKDE